MVVTKRSEVLILYIIGLSTPSLFGMSVVPGFRVLIFLRNYLRRVSLLSAYGKSISGVEGRVGGTSNTFSQMTLLRSRRGSMRPLKAWIHLSNASSVPCIHRGP